MTHKLDIERLQHAFKGRPDLIGAIQQAAAAPNWIELFNEITSYVSDLQTSASSEPASKKRKLEESLPINIISNGNGSTGSTSGKYHGSTIATAHDANEPPILQIKDISLVMPQRKKYTLEITKSYIRARHPETKELVPGISLAWKDISYAFCLPVPEKSQIQHNYIIFPQHSNLPTSQNPPGLEPLVFTVPATAPKPGTISGADASAASAVSDDYKMLFDWALARAFKDSGNSIKIIESDPKHFASVMKEAHRPNEKAVFVKGFRGSKDGYLFFLSTGILWGFKKPLLFLPRERIAAVSYVSVLQRTFNLSVEVYAGNGDAGGEDGENKEEFEFAMLDQEDFAGIDTYVKRHGLMDASMAEQRRAKRLGINVVKGEDGQKVDVGDAGELAKAEAELEDEEDEEEEDYDPGSEGESEGEGSSSDEEDGEGSGEEGAGDDDDDDDDDGDDGDDDEGES